MKIGIYLAAGIAALSVAACTPKTTGTPETNPALETIFSRTSIRTYQDRTVEPQKIELLLRAAMSAPSGKDQRPWEFVVVNERPILDSLAAALPYAKMLAQAPCAVIVCGSPARSSYWYLDCSAAAENILLAAHSLGLGGVWTAAYPLCRTDGGRPFESRPAGGNPAPVRHSDRLSGCRRRTETEVRRRTDSLQRVVGLPVAATVVGIRCRTSCVEPNEHGAFSCRIEY